jgi:threonine dehydrogenase-like Zn-dependent dehydrogenase
VVEINPAKLESAKRLGAIAVDAKAGDPVKQIRKGTAGKGVDVSLELIGSAQTMRQAVQCLAPLGRAALAGLTNESMSTSPYPELINRQAEIIGVSDHLASEIPALIEFARIGKLQIPVDALRPVNLDAGQINSALDQLQHSIDHLRTVIKVTSESEPARPPATYDKL